jgi:hypothetical protein
MDKEPSPECPFHGIVKNGNETSTNGHNKGNLEGRKKRDGKADQVREINRIVRRNIKKKL